MPEYSGGRTYTQQCYFGITYEVPPNVTVSTSQTKVNGRAVNVTTTGFTFNMESNWGNSVVGTITCSWTASGTV